MNGYYSSQVQARAGLLDERPSSRPERGSAPERAGANVPLDMNQLVYRCLGRIELAERLLASFESRFPDTLAQIEECRFTEDRENLARLVHQLKGSAANVSAPALHGVAMRIEDAIHAGDAEAFAREINAAHAAWAEFTDFKQANYPRVPG
ncbi:MAG: Hpt domain-containing protein [Pirellulaceae bacterium]|nr:Hpt domain-containing protein [Pirellulaceae bacterium]